MRLMPLCQAEKAKAVAKTAENPTAAHYAPVQARELGGGQEQDERGPEECRVSRDRERGVALQQTHREHGVCSHSDGGYQDQEVPRDARALDAHQPASRLQ